jgi:hypothetical protein
MKQTMISIHQNIEISAIFMIKTLRIKTLKNIKKIDMIITKYLLLILIKRILTKRILTKIRIVGREPRSNVRYHLD